MSNRIMTINKHRIKIKEVITPLKAMDLSSLKASLDDIFKDEPPRAEKMFAETLKKFDYQYRIQIKDLFDNEIPTNRIKWAHIMRDNGDEHIRLNGYLLPTGEYSVDKWDADEALNDIKADARWIYAQFHPKTTKL